MDSLESRVAALECKLLATAVNTDSDKVIDPLLDFSSKLGTACHRKEKLASLLKRVEELEKYTDPFFLEEKTNVESAAKLCYVTSMAKKAEESCNLIDGTDFNGLDVVGRPFLGSSQVSDVNDLSKQVSTCKLRGAEQTSSTATLLESYSNMVSTLNNILTTWDRKLTALESLDV